MQKVEIYGGALEAKIDMDKHIRNGWKIHTCTMATYEIRYGHDEKVLVVYEK